MIPICTIFWGFFWKDEKLKTKEEIISLLDTLFLRLKEYPLSEPIADAIDKNLELLREFDEEDELWTANIF